MRFADATTCFEDTLFEKYQLIAGVDEVGRGALAGPVAVGVALRGENAGAPPEGLRDSKLLSATRRTTLLPQLKHWCNYRVGYASASEIDEMGIVTGLKLAGTRALEQLADEGLKPDVIILDGSHNWLAGVPQVSCPVITRVKADSECAIVAAASVAAKVNRDTYMSKLPDPGYGFAAHKGYGTRAHRAAIVALGPGEQHRRSFKLI
ncbi:MAG: ribonuclease HII [Varibaculum sp.]|nr:ribonuclease HII [Varibaculum sp.]